MVNYIFLFFLLIAILFFLFNYNKIKFAVERQGLANENSEYIHPKIINNFITNQQNQYILEYATPRFQKSVVGSGLDNKIDNTVRNSQTAWIQKNDPIAKEIITKVCNMYNLPFENAEDLQVVKYEQGNYYKEHHDSFPFYEANFLSQGGHRVLTTLIYLNDDFEAGETRFVNLDKNIKPHKNSAIVFHSLDSENKRCHPKALHAGLPIKSGIKYIANVWIREGTFQYNIDTTSYDYIFNSILLSICKLFVALKVI
jgi:prolyl 4-hydroxylase